MAPNRLEPVFIISNGMGLLQYFVGKLICMGTAGISRQWVGEIASGFWVNVVSRHEERDGQWDHATHIININVRVLWHISEGKPVYLVDYLVS